MAPTPLIVIGRQVSIASVVRKGLLPEYDVIHIILSVEQGVKELPLLLSQPSQSPADTSDNAGSQNYGARPFAVAVGGGYDDAMFNEMKKACKDVEDDIPWLRVDVAKLHSMPPWDDQEAYGTETAKRAKAKLDELRAAKGSGEKIGGVHFFT